MRKGIEEIKPSKNQRTRFLEILIALKFLFRKKTIIHTCIDVICIYLLMLFSLILAANVTSSFFNYN